MRSSGLFGKKSVVPKTSDSATTKNRKQKMLGIGKRITASIVAVKGEFLFMLSFPLAPKLEDSAANGESEALFYYTY